jgi:hypothetical protein
VSPPSVHVLPPNLLGLLADMGVGGGDDDRIERVLDAMLRHQLPDGRFALFATGRDVPHRAWGSLLCDTHSITEGLLRFGRRTDPRVSRALQTMVDDLTVTSQGRAWPCRPDDESGFRGPGRTHDFCPQATLEALRAWSYMPMAQRPEALHDIARVSLRAWTARADEQPYMFGHGSRFKVVKWPTTWCDIHAVLDTLGRYPELWRGRDSDAGDRRALVELIACMVAYNMAADGTVTPQSCYRGFERFSFRQKPSPFATARVLQVLQRFGELNDGSEDAGRVVFVLVPRHDPSVVRTRRDGQGPMAQRSKPPFAVNSTAATCREPRRRRIRPMCMTRRTSSLRRVLAAVALTASVAACSSDLERPVTSDGGGPITVAQLLARSSDAPISVQGLLLVDQGSARLCGAILESYPPQCGAPSVELVGVDIVAIDGTTTVEGITWKEGAVLILERAADGRFTVVDAAAEQGVQIVLGIYSGVPDPTWALTGEQAEELAAALAGLTRVDAIAPIGGLGYHGFTIVDANRTLVAYAGKVVSAQADPRYVLDDPGRSIELLLFRTAGPHLTPDELDVVAEALDLST